MPTTAEQQQQQQQQQRQQQRQQRFAGMLSTSLLSCTARKGLANS
jgi:hypothetical protein